MGRFRSATLLSFTVILSVLVFFGAQSQIPTVFALPSFTSSNVSSPGTNTCTGCHSGSAAAGGSTVVNFPSGLTYTPGVTQHLSVTVTDPTHTVWSYLLTARLASSVSSQAGSFTATDSASTVVPNGSIQDIESASFSVSTWNFDWTPPATASGNVTFYLIGLAAGSPGGSTSGNGIYQSTATLTPASGPPPATLSASPTSLSFTYQQGGTTPAAQNISVTSSGAALNYTVSAAATGGTWLSATPASGTSPGTVSVAVNPTGLAAGTYNGTVTITSAGATGSPQTASVSLVVTAAPTLSATPTTLSFAYQIGGTTPPTQPISVSSSGAALNYTVSAAATGGTWLSATPASGTTPGSVSVAVNPTGLAAGTFNGTVTITSAGATGSPQTVSVSLVVSAPPTLSATPTTLSFGYQIGGATPATQPISVSSSGSALSFTAAASGGTWLSATPTSGTTPGTVNVAVNPTGLAAGTYNGTVTITSTGATGSPKTISVSLVVSATPVLSATPTTLSFNYLIGAATPATQPVSVTSSGAALSFTAVASGGTWLSATPASGTTPGTVSVAVNPTGLAAGTYNGTVTITSAGATGSPQTVSVSLVVSAPPTLSATPTTLSFGYQIGGATPATQPISVSSSGAALSFMTAASGGTWLSATPTSGTTPGTVNVAVNPTGLAAGTYNGTVTVTSAGATGSPKTVGVSLVVSAAPPQVLSATPATLSFTYQIGAATPATQPISVSSSGAALSFMTAASGGTWLSATPASGTTPGTVTVAVNPTGLAAGTYNGTVTITSAGATGSPMTVSVSLVVSAAAPPVLTATPTALSFNYLIGTATPATQPISVSSSGTALAFTTAASGGTWLSATPASGTTPGTVNVAVNPAGLAAGTYNGTVSITSAGATGSPQTVSVSLVVTAPPALSATPATLSFSYQIGAAAPATQTISVTSNGAALNFTAAAPGGTWLSATPTSGTTPGTVSVFANPSGLTAGTYNGTVTVTSTGATGGPKTISVSLVVSAAASPGLSATPTTLAFNYQIGAATPVAQPISVKSSGAALSYTTAASGGTWLTATPASGTTPGTVSVAVNPAGLAAGTYNGTVTVASAGALGSPQAIAVSLVVTAGTGNSTMTVAPGSLQFNYQNGGSLPSSQALTVASTNFPLAFTASSSNASWLTASPTGGTTPGTIAVSINPAQMSAGSYTALITLIASGANSVIVPVTLNVTQNLSNTTTSGSSYPAIAVDVNSNIDIAWLDSASGILFRRSTDGGRTFSTAKAIPGSAGASFQPQMIVDASGSIDIVWTGAGGTTVLFSRSTDGITFSVSPKLVAQNLGGILISAPRIGLDSNGGTNIVWGQTDEYFSRSSDAGVTFSTPAKLSTAAGNISASRIAASSTGNLYVVWSDEQNRTTTGNCNEFFTRSLDKGVTFSAPVSVYNVGCSHDNMQVAVDPFDTILFLWSNDIPFKDVLVSRSVDSGSTFMTPISLAQGAAVSLQGAIYKNGNIYVVWAGDPTASTGIYFSSSIDHGVTFATPGLLSFAGAAGTLPPASPQIAVDAAGNIYVIWQQGTNGTNTFDVFFTHSADAGATFQTIMKVSGTSSLECATATPCGSAEFAVDAIGDSNIVWVDHAATVQNSNIDFSRVAIAAPASDFTMSISPASQSAAPGGTASYTLALAATGGFNQTVTLSCGGLPAGLICATPIPAALTPPGSAIVNVNLANTIAPGTYSFTINAASGATTHVQAAQVVVGSLTLIPSSSSATITAGSSGSFMMTAASTMGSADAVTFSCPGAPSGVSCTFAPAQVSVPGNGNATTTLTVTVTSKPSSGSLYKFPKGTLPSQRLMLWWFIAALSLMLAGMIASSRRGRAGSPILAPGAAIIILTLVLSAGLVSCGLTGAPKTTTTTNTNTQPVSFTLTVQAQDQTGSVKVSTPLQITVP